MNIQPQLLISLPSGGEWIWIALIIIVLFGAKKIPGLMGGLGKGIKEFKDAKDGSKDDAKEIENK
jgi:sec-independent protein translocase protein TatA